MLLGSPLLGSHRSIRMIARRSSIATDPSSILVFTQDPDAQGQPLVGSFSIPTDPHALLESISKYEMRVGLSSWAISKRTK